MAGGSPPAAEASPPLADVPPLLSGWVERPTTKRLVFALRAAIRAVGLTFKEVEKRLNVSGGYLTRLFAGQMPIRVDQITEIAEAAGLDPEKIYRLAFQKPVTPESEIIRRAITPRPKEAPQPSQWTEEPASMLVKEVERLIERLVEKKLNERLG